MKNIYLLCLLMACNLSFAQPNWEKTSCGDDPQTYEMSALFEDGEIIVVNFANLWSAVCSVYTEPLNDIYVNYGSGEEGVQFFNFVTTNDDLEPSNCYEVLEWGELIGCTFPSFENCVDMFSEYGEIYGYGIALTLVFIPDPESPGEGILVYSNFSDIGVVTGDPFIDITAVLEENGVFASSKSFDADATIEAYPNPTSGLVTFSEQLNNVEVYNSTGQLIISSITSSDIDLSQFPDGLYLIKSDEGTQKIIKE